MWPRRRADYSLPSEIAGLARLGVMRHVPAANSTPGDYGGKSERIVRVQAKDSPSL
jgi:hypothetical protein